MRFGNETVEPFVGIGFSFVGFLESSSGESISGTKVGLEARAGVRIGTQFIKPSQHPSLKGGPKELDVELMLGQRLHQMFGIGAGAGFNMSAARFGVSLVLKF